MSERERHAGVHAAGDTGSIIKPIVRGDNDQLFDADGRCFTDLFSANGTAWLGHCNPSVVHAVSEQLTSCWNVGALPSDRRQQALDRLGSWFSDRYTVAGLYSTGMEASEFALRVARRVTGRAGVAGFAGSMHGKSMACAYLGWDNRDGVQLPGFSRLPFIDTVSESESLSALTQTLKSGEVGAVFVEPIHATSGAHRASDGFHRQVARLCSERGALLVYDECLTGFGRTGVPFYHRGLEIEPDVVLVGKALGNGFPVSAVVVKSRYTVTPQMLPGSTYAGNPLAAAAAVGALDAMSTVDPCASALAIQRLIGDAFAGVEAGPVELRGRGALWSLECPSPAFARGVAVDCHAQGVLVGLAGPFVRLLPAATIAPARLARGFETVLRAIERRSRAGT